MLPLIAVNGGSIGGDLKNHSLVVGCIYISDDSMRGRGILHLLGESRFEPFIYVKMIESSLALGGGGGLREKRGLIGEPHYCKADMAF